MEKLIMKVTYSNSNVAECKDAATNTSDEDFKLLKETNSQQMVERSTLFSSSSDSEAEPESESESDATDLSAATAICVGGFESLSLGEKADKKKYVDSDSDDEEEPEETTTNGNHGVEKTTGSSLEGFGSVASGNFEDLVAYIRNTKTHEAGIGPEAMVQSYNKWAGTYDQDLCPGRYNGPSIAASTMAKHYPNLQGRENLKIIDVGAGTGRVGFELVKLGFKLIDAIEPSGGMLQLLEQRGIYGKIFKEFIGAEQIQGIQESSYDALVISGGMGEGHIPTVALHEMLRIVKPNGHIFIVMREEYLNVVAEYKNKLEPEMKQLEEAGLWKQVSRRIVPNYSFDKNGIVYVYQVTKGC